MTELLATYRLQLGGGFGFAQARELVPYLRDLADEITSILMGDDVESRKNFIVTNAREVRNLDF